MAVVIVVTMKAEKILRVCKKC